MTNSMDEVNDFYGPYQIRKMHDGHELIFVKGVPQAFDPTSERLREIVDQKLAELAVEYTKWKTLSERINDV